MDEHLRSLFAIYSKLAVVQVDKSDVSGNSSSEDQDQSELLIFLRKQLNSTDIRYRRMGVLGAVALLDELTTVHEPGQPVPIWRTQKVSPIVSLWLCSHPGCPFRPRVCCSSFKKASKIPLHCKLSCLMKCSAVFPNIVWTHSSSRVWQGTPTKPDENNT